MPGPKVPQPECCSCVTVTVTVTGPVRSREQCRVRCSVSCFLTNALDSASSGEPEVARLTALRGARDPGVILAQGRGGGPLGDPGEAHGARRRRTRAVVDAGREGAGKGAGGGLGYQEGPEEDGEEGELRETHPGPLRAGTGNLVWRAGCVRREVRPRVALSRRRGAPSSHSTLRCQPGHFHFWHRD